MPAILRFPLGALAAVLWIWGGVAQTTIDRGIAYVLVSMLIVCFVLLLKRR